jgi:hypothetical protein
LMSCHPFTSSWNYRLIYLVQLLTWFWFCFFAILWLELKAYTFSYFTSPFL